jgi:hypothetical protein
MHLALSLTRLRIFLLYLLKVEHMRHLLFPTAFPAGLFYLFASLLLQYSVSDGAEGDKLKGTLPDTQRLYPSLWFKR